MWSCTLKRSCEYRVKNIIEKCNLSTIVDSNYTSKYRLLHIKKILFEMDEKEWHEQLYNDNNKPNGNKLRTYRLYKNNLVTCHYAENVYCRNKRLDFRTYKYCADNVLEDEKHFLLHCEFYSDLPFDLFAQSKSIEVNFEDFNENDKLYVLMNNSNVQDFLAKTLVLMYKRKKHADIL